MNECYFMGNLGRDPVVKCTQTGKTYEDCEFRGQEPEEGWRTGKFISEGCRGL